MRSPLENGTWHEFESVVSTQDQAAHALREGETGVFFAHQQTLGRGRFGREWLSSPGDSLTMSMSFEAYADHPKPYLVGMTVAVAAASVIFCELKWPNDLILGNHKIGGILTEIVADSAGRRIPVVGIGINLNNLVFPEELAKIATSVKLYKGGVLDPIEVAKLILDRFAKMPEPDSWSAVKEVWDLFDYTAGRKYQLPSGEIGSAIGIGAEAQLVLNVDGELREVYAADAFFGNQTNEGN